jgi:hypothetical protein
MAYLRVLSQHSYGDTKEDLEISFMISTNLIKI